MRDEDDRTANSTADGTKYETNDETKARRSIPEFRLEREAEQSRSRCPKCGAPVVKLTQSGYRCLGDHELTLTDNELRLKPDIDRGFTL